MSNTIWPLKLFILASLGDTLLVGDEKGTLYQIASQPFGIVVDPEVQLVQDTFVLIPELTRQTNFFTVLDDPFSGSGASGGVTQHKRIELQPVRTMGRTVYIAHYKDKWYVHLPQ